MSETTGNSFFTVEDYQISRGPIQRVYDLSYYGFDGIFNLHQMNPATITNVTNSATATVYNFLNATNVPIRLNNPCLLSNKDSIVLAGPAAKTNLNVSFEVTPDMDALIHEVNLLIPFGLTIGTYDTGSPTINSCAMTTTYEDTGEVIPKLTNTFTPSGLSALGATGTQVFVVNDTINPFITVQKGRSILITLTTSCNFGTGNTTGFAGIFQDLSYGKQISPAAPIYYYPASMFVHIHPTTSHVNPLYITGGITP